MDCHLTNSITLNVVYSADEQSRVELLTVEQLVAGLQESSGFEASSYAEELIKRFEPLLKKTWRRTDPSLEYTEFLQEVLVRLFSGLPRLKNHKAFPGYFRRIAMSVAIDHIRKQMNERQILNSRDRQKWVGRIDDELVPGIIIQSYLAHLPTRDKEILSLEFIDELPPQKIAQKLGLSASAARMARRRALNRLRKLLFEEVSSLETRLDTKAAKDT